MRKTPNIFVHWLGPTLLGFMLLFSGLEIMRVSWHIVWESVAGGAVISLLGGCLMIWAELRERPRRLLRKARRTLTFPTQWAVKFDKNLPDGGTIPVAVIRSDGVRFVVDIQGFQDAMWTGPLMPADGVLVDPRGKPFPNDPVAALMQAAEAWSATPILWLPQARQVHNMRQEGCPLIVVMGGPRELSHVMRGAEIAPRRETEGLELTMPPKPARRLPTRKPRAAVKSPELA